MDKNPRPNITKISRTMATQHARAVTSINATTARVDGLVAAAAKQDWRAVKEISRELAEESREQGYREVTALAERVQQEAHKPRNEVGVKRSLIRLIGTCGRSTTG